MKGKVMSLFEIGYKCMYGSSQTYNIKSIFVIIMDELIIQLVN